MRFSAPSFSVYREAVTPSGIPEPGGLAVTRSDRIPAEGYETVFREGGVALIRRLADEPVSQPAKGMAD
jgi:hypothetical protein